jgi:hypothetical protein
LRQAYLWLKRGCEIGMYPYVIPFSGAALARDPELVAHTLTTRRRVAGTAVEWEQPSKILPLDPLVRTAILQIEQSFESRLARLQGQGAHLPSRVRSLIWIACSAPVMRAHGLQIADEADLQHELDARVPRPMAPAAVAYA